MQWEYSGTVQVTKNDTLVLYLSLFSSHTTEASSSTLVMDVNRHD